MNLRPYQDKCVGAILSELRGGSRSTLAVLPTGCGKTVCFAHIADRWEHGRILVLAHREELIFQAADKLGRVMGAPPGIEMGEIRAANRSSQMFGNSPVIVSSVQTQNSGRKCDECGGKGYVDQGDMSAVPCTCLDGQTRRMQRFDPYAFGLVIVDEAHHAPAESYRRIIDYYSRNPDLRILGVTATPDRHDEAALGKIFDSVAFEMGILDAIDDGWLVPIRQEFVKCTDLDFSKVRTTAGDFNGADLEKLMIAEKPLHEVASPTIEIAGDRPTLVFATSVAHADLMADIFNRHRKDSAICIHGGTPSDVRRDRLRQYARGEFQFLCGCGVFLEGFDEPRIEVIAMARPTKSRALYAQAVGRGTRPIEPPSAETAEGRRHAIAASCKPGCLVIDFVGNAGQHKLVTTADILGGNFEDEIVERAVKKARERGGSCDMREEMETLRRDEAAEKRQRERITARSNFTRRPVDPFDVFDMSSKREPGWHKGRMPTKNQLAFLGRNGVQTRDLSFHKASNLIEEIKRREAAGLCTYRQAQVLAKWGHKTDVSYDEATERIREINLRLETAYAG